MSGLTQDQLKTALCYFPETGDFIWKSREDRNRAWNSRRAGTLAGTYDAQGYRVIIIDYVSYKSHRLAWLYVHGRWPVEDMDHINRDKQDNRLVNLRECSRSMNNHNRGLLSNSSSGINGVSFCRTTNRWRAKIRVSGKQLHLGRFDTPEEAGEAYYAAKVRLTS